MLYVLPRANQLHSTRDDVNGQSQTSSTFSGDYYASLTTASRSASTSSPLLWASHHDTSSSAACPLATRKPSALVATRKVNANSYCGRHSDEFLFGGKGLGDLWRAVTKK